MRPPWRVKVGVALGGGAARGLAHIGVLRGLINEGVPVDVVVGTSMGAIIGGAYAAMGSVEEVERRMRGLLASDDFRRLRLSFLRETRERRGVLDSVTTFVRRGLLYGISTLRPSFLSAEQFAANLTRLLPDDHIERLPIPFAAIALDLQAGEEVVLHRGPLRQAVSASSAIPGVLPPVRLGNRVLVDGGWVDKVPVLPAYRLGADLVIAVDISADLEDTRGYNRGIDVIIRANAVKDTILANFIRRLADLVLEPSVRTVHWADFGAIDQCIAAGEEAAVRAAPAIRELLRQERWRGVLRPSVGRRLTELYLATGELHMAFE